MFFNSRLFYQKAVPYLSRLLLALVLIITLTGVTPTAAVRAADPPPPPVKLFLPLSLNGSGSSAAFQPVEPEPLTPEELMQLAQAAEPAGTLAAKAKGRRIIVNTYEDDLINNGNCTLREAVQAANLDTPVDKCHGGRGFDVIMLKAGTYTLTLDQVGVEDGNAWGDLDLHGSAVFFGHGNGPAVISGNGSDRPLEVFPGVQAVLFHITLTGGLMEDEGVEEDYQLLSGGGLRNAGHTILTHSSVEGNLSSMDGMGVYNSGSLELFHAAISNNGAIYVMGRYGGGLYNTGQVSGRNVEISGNQLDSDGAAIYNTGQVNLTQVILRNNQSSIYDSWGGAIRNSGEMRLTDGELYGGAAMMGGLIFNTGALELNNMHLSGGAARATFAAALWNEGDLLFRQGSLSENAAVGLSNHGWAELDQVLVSGNIAYAAYGPGDGAGITNSGVMTITHSTITGNDAEDRGGGISNGGRMLLRDSTVSGNTSEGNIGQGGGIASSGALIMENVTLSGNHAENGGGGLWLDVYQRLELTNVDVVSNTTATGYGGGLFLMGITDVSITASMFANNQDGPNFAPDCYVNYGFLPSAGYNLVGDLGGCKWTAGPGDLLGTAEDPLDAMLGPLADNGGPTLTHAVLPGSPAIDAADNVCLAFDQRGVSRPQGPACDIGSFELEQ